MSDFPKDIPIMMKINRVVSESPNVKTIILDGKITASPGQFVMAWLPGVGEKPFSLSSLGDETAITVQKKGKFTEHLCDKKPRDMIGIRGPYGSGFTTAHKKKACVVAGGLGIASVITLIEQLDKPTVIYGAKTKDELIFLDRLKGNRLIITTDDGSEGRKGVATDAFSELAKESDFDVVYTCGPEIMMKKLLDICNAFGVELQASLERYMKCGFGICGSCVINGLRVCKDGPVFSSSQLAQMNEFGAAARIKTGELVNLVNYVNWRDD